MNAIDAPIPVDGCCTRGAPAMPVETARRLATRFKALGDPTRLAIISQLAGAGEVCVCNLVPESGLGQPTISHHLKLLREAGLVASERRGTWAHYRLVPEAVADLAAALTASE